MTDDLAAFDPDVRQVLEAMRRASAPPMHEMGVAAVRTMIETMPRAAGPDMASVVDRTLDGPHGPLPVRILRPRAAPSHDASALVWCHGGGMIMGSLSSFDRLAREVAEYSGSVVINVEYRLAPEHTYPVANDEAYAAALWTVEHAQELGVAPHLVGIGGDSAGGGLTAATALRARNEGGPAFAQQVLVYPGLERRRDDRPSMQEFGANPLLRADDIDWMKSAYLGPDANTDDAYGCPALATDLTDLPPAIVVSAHGDPLRDGAEDYGRRLRDAGVPTAAIRYPGLAHGFLMQTASFARARVAMIETCGLVAARFAAMR